MINAHDLHEAEQLALGRLAELDLALAARMHGLAMAAEDPKAITDHVRSYQRASRCVRQTIMLRARLRRDHERHVIAVTPRGLDAIPDDAFDPPIDPVEARIDGRVMDLQEAAARIVAQAAPADTTPAERAEGLDRIDAWIDAEIEADEDFGAQDLDEHVLVLCRAFHLPEALGRQFRDLPRAPREEEGPNPGAYTFGDAYETG